MTPPTTDSLSPGDARDELIATVALVRAGVGSRRGIGPMVDAFGSAVRLIQLTEDHRLFATPDASHDVVGPVKPSHIKQAAVDVERWVERGIDARSVLDESYPHDLRSIFNHPPLLFVMGRWESYQQAPAVAVVGARKASPTGLRESARFATAFARAGVTVLSGLAVGIDAAAHAAALDANGRTAAVMGTGVDRIYPEVNIPLSKRILAEGGALLSQFLPEQPPTQWTFPMRNVVMSGLASATVVIEASETSGARAQARVALQHGRTVFLLRTLVDSHAWAHRFATEGAYGTHAIVVDDPEEILGRLRPRPFLDELAVA